MRISDWSSDVCSSDLGTRAIRIDTVFAGTKAKYLLQDLYGFAHRPGVWIRAKEMPLALRAAPVVHDTGRCVIRNVQVGVGLVVPKKDVVARLQAFEIGRASCRERVCQYV